MDRMVNGSNTPLLEQVVQFAAARHKLIAEDIANVDTPGFRQKDLSIERFQEMLRERLGKRSAGDEWRRFEDVGREVANPERGILFHDGNNRSMERLVSDLAKNAMMHNLAIELLRKQYMTMEMALKERVG
ncbi:MAG: flagellar basal body rod protein FlgB [Planctomycetota bacterium]|nr:flagellar basal body rod protein FlgB [Planctomycetota bacterium]